MESNSLVAKPTRMRGRKETGHGACTAGGTVHAKNQRPTARKGHLCEGADFVFRFYDEVKGCDPLEEVVVEAGDNVEGDADRYREES